MAGLLAALAAWFLNRFVLARMQVLGVILLGPFSEELLKTLLALYFGASIILTHAFFGLIEGFIDIKTANKGLVAALVSFISHSLLGILTYGLYLLTESVLAAIAGAGLMHALWNAMVVKIITSDRVK